MADIDPQKMEYIQQHYPGFVGFLQIPDIASVLIAAAEGNWDPNKVDAWIFATEWWRNTPEQQRIATAQQIVDPASYAQNVNNKADMLRLTLLRLGIPATPDELKFIAAGAMNLGLTDAQIISRAVNELADPNESIGLIGETTNQVKGIAESFGMPVSDEAAFGLARMVVSGERDSSFVTDYFRRGAITYYGNNKDLVDALNRGITVRQYADPYIQFAANELEISPNDASMYDEKWTRPLRYAGANDGMGMTMYDWQRVLRTDPAYGWDKTTAARTTSAQFADKLLNMFGAKGSLG